MRSVLPWIAVYLAILLVWALIILRRTGPTLWKGRSLVALNAVFVLASIAATVREARMSGDAQGDSYWCCLPLGLIVFDLALIIVAIVAREKWLLLRMSHAQTAAILEKCFAQTRAPWVRGIGGYAVQCGGVEMVVTTQPAFAGLVSVRFAGASESKKAELVRNLFGKQFHRSVPTPRIRA